MAIHVASALGFENIVSLILEKADLNDKDNGENTALHVASENG